MVERLLNKIQTKGIDLPLTTCELAARGLHQRDVARVALAA